MGDGAGRPSGATTPSLQSWIPGCGTPEDLYPLYGRVRTWWRVSWRTECEEPMPRSYIIHLSLFQSQVIMSNAQRLGGAQMAYGILKTGFVVMCYNNRHNITLRAVASMWCARLPSTLLFLATKSIPTAPHISTSGMQSKLQNSTPNRTRSTRSRSCPSSSSPS